MPDGRETEDRVAAAMHALFAHSEKIEPVVDSLIKDRMIYVPSKELEVYLLKCDL